MNDTRDYHISSGLTREIGRYLAATGLSASLSLCLPVALHELAGLREEAAVGLGLLMAMIVNFVSIRVYVFRSSGRIAQQLWRFIATSAAFRLGEYGLFLLFFQLLNLNYIIALLISLGISFVGKYLVQKKFVFS